MITPLMILFSIVVDSKPPGLAIYCYNHWLDQIAEPTENKEPVKEELRRWIPAYIYGFINLIVD